MLFQDSNAPLVPRTITCLTDVRAFWDVPVPLCNVDIPTPDLNYASTALVSNNQAPEAANSNANISRPRVAIAPVPTLIVQANPAPAELEEDNAMTGDEDEEDDGKFIRPKGECGRQNSGGYNLRMALGWSVTDYEKVRKFVKNLTEKFLDRKLTYMAQDPDVVDEVINQACAKYPVLENYRSLWPLHDFIRMALKYTRSQDKKVVNKARAVNAKRNLRSRTARSRRGSSV